MGRPVRLPKPDYTTFSADMAAQTLLAGDLLWQAKKVHFRLELGMAGSYTSLV
jgi:hypothetical protein